ncbi:hypothetical protein GCM10009000_070390 [Halobacterium noricense]|uniref:Uncharacterized protein n=1 Tax=Haladaptatus pallidirubidus TaxID=1008152 RepID=A0AAV3UKY4_9EURY
MIGFGRVATTVHFVSVATTDANSNETVSATAGRAGHGLPAQFKFDEPFSSAICPTETDGKTD